MADFVSNDGGRTVSIETALKEPDIVFYNTRRDPFMVYGLYHYRTEDVCRRLPENVAQATSKSVAHLSLETAGARLRFSTDSAYVAIKAIMPYINRFSHMPLTGTTGFDLYIDSDGGSRYYKTFKPDTSISGGYESIIKFDSRKTRQITINFPSYNAVDDLYIGVQENSRIGLGAFYRTKLPIVYYGSSITQGACTSRPGLTYQNIISRKYNIDYMNLGFSGSGRAEPAIVDYMASRKMLAFVSDYDHNAPTVEYLRETHRRMYDTIRAAHPDIPYIMLSRPDFTTHDIEDSAARRDVVIDTYRYARENGDKNVYYIDGEGIFRGPEEDSCTVDGSHPNDLGMMKMAEAIGRVLERALRGNIVFSEE